MSVALVLFCVSAVAQNENQTRNTTDESFGVTASEQTITLWAGNNAIVGITLLPRYNDPYLMFEGRKRQHLWNGKFPKKFCYSVND